MKINPLQNTGKDYTHFPFCSKKILYTDFDSTYFPFTREDVRPENAPQFSKMYLPFGEFKKSEKDDFQIMVTTGRSKNDFEHTLSLIKNAGVDFCHPDGLITSNGANAFLFIKGKNGTEAADVTEFEEEPFVDIAQKFIEITKEQDPDTLITEALINGKTERYGKYSSEYALDNNPKRKNKHIELARDGKYNIAANFSKEVNDDAIVAKLRDFIIGNNLPFSIEHYKDSPFDTVTKYTPYGKIHESANVLFVKYSADGEIPDKFNIVEKKLKEVAESGEGDIVIAAGDSFNDEKMLNPLNYLEAMGINTEDRSEDELLEDKNVIAALQKMPLRVIICGNYGTLDSLRELNKKLLQKDVHIITEAKDTINDYPKAVKRILEEN